VETIKEKRRFFNKMKGTQKKKPGPPRKEGVHNNRTPWFEKKSQNFLSHPQGKRGEGKWVAVFGGRRGYSVPGKILGRARVTVTASKLHENELQPLLGRYY